MTYTDYFSAHSTQQLTVLDRSAFVDSVVHADGPGYWAGGGFSGDFDGWVGRLDDGGQVVCATSVGDAKVLGVLNAPLGGAVVVGTVYSDGVGTPMVSHIDAGCVPLRLWELSDAPAREPQGRSTWAQTVGSSSVPRPSGRLKSSGKQ